MSNDTQPEIRFPGFTEAWKQRKLGEVSKIGDIDHRMPPSVDDGIPYLMTGDFIEENELNFENTKLVSEDDYLQLSKKIRPEYGDILFARYASVGAVRYVSTHRKFLISYSCAIIKPFSDIDGQFLYPTLKTQKMQQKIEFEINPNSQKNIGIDSLKKLPLFIPKMDEQQKIGTFFKQLDDTIALHQRKLDLLKETKKGFLQKMFPKNGAKVPEIRFPGFTGDWEQRKLGDVLSERNDQTPETNEYPLMSFVQGKGVTPKGERYNRSFLVKDSEKKYKKTELGDFIYSSNNLETGSIGFNRTGKAVISPVYSIFKSKKSRESQFIGIMSARKDFISKMVRFRQGVVYGQWRIHESDFLNIDMKMPNDKEQQLIISFFENIDKTIALHQRKLDLLKETKKGFLQKMFV